MAFFWSVIVAMCMVCVCQQLECNRLSISCNDIRAEHPRGFTFLYNCSTGNEVFAYVDKTVIAHANLKKRSSNLLPEVISIGDSSIVMTECRDLKIQCLLYDGPHLREIWKEFEVTEMSPVTPPLNPSEVTPPLNPSKVTPPWKLIIGLSLAILMLIIGFLCYYWRNAIMFRCVGSLQSCCCQGDGGCCASCPSRCHKDDAIQISTTGDVATPHDDVSLVGIDTSEPHGGGGNEQDNTTEPVQANGNLKDDPGGASAVRTMNQNNGCTHGDRGLEGQPLLDQRAAVHSSDMTIVVVDLVNKHDFDPDRVSTCSTTQDTDVESNPI